jgi:hypothetical protein
MKFTPWLAGAAGVAALTLGFGTSASATTHHTAPARLAPRSFDARHLNMAVLPRVTPGTTYNTNWAGYIALGDKNVALRYVGADFNIPSLNCTGAAQGATVAQFVGLQDWTAPGELTGIQGTCNSDGTYSYQAFYAIGSGEAVSAGTINPGDAIQASVYFNSSTKKYTFFLNDVTEGTPLFNTAVSCPSGSTCSTGTAEAISDDPINTQNGLNFPLANYGMENFTGGAVTSRDGLKGGFSSSKLWGSAELGVKDSGGVILESPSSLAGGTAFNNTWHAAS